MIDVNEAQLAGDRGGDGGSGAGPRTELTNLPVSSDDSGATRSSEEAGKAVTRTQRGKDGGKVAKNKEGRGPSSWKRVTFGDLKRYQVAMALTDEQLATALGVGLVSLQSYSDTNVAMLYVQERLRMLIEAKQQGKSPPVFPRKARRKEAKVRATAAKEATRAESPPIVPPQSVTTRCPESLVMLLRVVGTLEPEQLGDLAVRRGIANILHALSAPAHVA
jgi:hypothetical protein